MLMGEISLQQALQGGACIALAAEIAVEVRQGALESQKRWVLVYRPADDLLQLREPSLLAVQHEQREPVRDDSVPALGPLADCERLRDQLLGLLEPAFHEREHRSTCAHVPLLCGLAKLASERVQRLELDLDAGTIAEDPKAVEAVVVPGEDLLLVATAIQ